MGLRRGAAIFVLALTAGLCGCQDEPLGPNDTLLDGTWALHEVNGTKVPAVASHGSEFTYILIADTLRFAVDGTVSRSQTVRRIGQGASATDTTYNTVHLYPYVREGNSVKIGYTGPCPPNALCLGFEPGAFVGRFLAIEGRFWSGHPTLMYRRARSP